MKRSWWLINVTGYGAFAYYGTTVEAEDMRRHKANWEGGRGTKSRIAADHPDAMREIEFLRKQESWGYRLGAGFDERDIATLEDHKDTP